MRFRQVRILLGTRRLPGGETGPGIPRPLHLCKFLTRTCAYGNEKKRAGANTAHRLVGRAIAGGDGGSRTPVQNREPAASYVRSRHFACRPGLLPTGYRDGEPDCLRRSRSGGLDRRALPW
jgi:hypothetical protein